MKTGYLAWLAAAAALTLAACASGPAPSPEWEGAYGQTDQWEQRADVPASPDALEACLEAAARAGQDPYEACGVGADERDDVEGLQRSRGFPMAETEAPPPMPPRTPPPPPPPPPPSERDVQLRRCMAAMAEAGLDPSNCWALTEEEAGGAPAEAPEGEPPADEAFVMLPEPAAGPSADPGDGPEAIDVFYATDRTLKERSRGGALYYSADWSGALTYGVTRVTIPPTHDCGAFESPPFWRAPDAQRDIVFQTYTVLPEDAFFIELRNGVSETAGKEAFVFIHGFSVSFEDAARRTAQMHRDLVECYGAPDAAPILYSWPASSGVLNNVNPFSYQHDLTTSEQTVPLLAEFLEDVARRTGAQKIHVVAHSMGNNALARALDEVADDLAPGETLPLGQIVFAAADIDRALFVRLADDMSRVGARRTLYANKNDKALIISKTIRQNIPRAGDSTPPLTIAPAVDTIDASDVATEIFGVNHSFFAEASILGDIARVFRDNADPDERGLTRAGTDDGAYWVVEGN